jgi:N-acetylglucosamine-6-phosphate deacetylase
MPTTPKYFDLQVNGYAGVDFNGNSLTADDLHLVCQQLSRDGVHGILATIITADVEAMCRRLAHITKLREQDEFVERMIQGFHIEGPFLNEQPGYIGAHPAEHAIPADAEIMCRLLEAAKGLTRIVTLAPERDVDLRVTRMLADAGICVSAGHCDPTLSELQAAVDAGLSMFTHLGNGCPLQLHRHDNVIQRVLSMSQSLWIGFIADGVHVPFTALGNYLRTATIDRCFVVSDAISAAGLGPGEFKLGDQSVIVDEHLATWSADRSHLMGSAGTMDRAAMNLRTSLGLSENDVQQLTWLNPRNAITRRD